MLPIAQEHLIPVQKTARFHTLGLIGPQIRQIWFVIHGYGQLSSFFIKHFEGIVDFETLVVAPEGMSLFYIPPGWQRVGATWMTKEKRQSEIDDYVAFLDQVKEHVLAEIGHHCQINLLGFSQGATTAWRWAKLGNAAPKHFVNWAGSLPEELGSMISVNGQRTHLYYVHSSEDEYISAEAAQKQTLALQKLDPSLKTYHFDGNHRMDDATLQAIYNDILKA